MRVKSFIVIFAITWHVSRTEFSDGLTDYESIVNVLSTYQSYDPRSKRDITEREILSYKKPLNVYPSLGVAISNNIFRLDKFFEEFQELAGLIDQLEDFYPSSPFVSAAKDSKERLGMFFHSICNFGNSPMKRFLYNPEFSNPENIISIAWNWIVGAEDEGLKNQTRAEYKQEASQEVKELTEFFNKNIADLKIRTQTTEDRIFINEQAFALNHHLQRMYQFLQFLLDPQTYTYNDYNFLDTVAAKLKNNSRFTSLMNQSSFGLQDRISLLTLSDTDSILLTEDGHYDCSKSQVLTKFSTIVADSDVVAKRTEDKYRYSIGNQKSLYLNPDFLMSKSAFRPHESFSTMRKIIADDGVVSGILPYNNTIFLVNSISDLGEITKTCKNFTQTKYIFKDPIFELPYGCSLTGNSLNISKFELIYNFNEISEDVSASFNFGEHSFSALYHKEEDEKIRTEEFELAQKIHKIFNLEQRITQIEMEEIQTKDWKKRTANKAKQILHSSKSFLKSWQSEIAAEPFYKICVGLLLTGVGLYWAAFFWRRYRQRKSQEQYLSLIGGK